MSLTRPFWGLSRKPTNLLTNMTPLAAAMCLCATAASAASTDSAKSDAKNIHNHTLEEVIVSASPLHNQHSDNARPIAVISGDELRTQATATLAETLQGQAGVDSASFGPGVGNPVIRGQSGNRVKVMQDNLDTLDASNTSADHANTTEPLLADQIEVLRGPSTLRFGSGAIGGIVNVIDGRIPATAKPLSGALEARYSTQDNGKATVARLDGSNDVGENALGWHLDGLWRDSGNSKIPGYADPDDTDLGRYGVLENSAHEAEAFNLGSSWITDSGFIGLAVNHLHNQYGIPEGAHSHEEDEDEHEEEGHEEEDHEEEGPVRIDLKQTRFDVKGEYNNDDSAIKTWRLRLAHNDYQHKELEGAETGTVFTNKAWEGRIEALHQPIAGWEGAFGLQSGYRNYGAEGEEAFIPQSSIIQSNGLFWIGERHWQHQWLEAGVRIERQNINPDNQSAVSHTATSGSLGYHWSLNDEHNFSVQFSHAQRAPSLEELFADGAHIAAQVYALGDKDLDSETSNNLDLGYEWVPDNDGLLEHAQINVFYNRISDFIYQNNTGVEDTESGYTIYQEQQQDANFRGAEGELLLRMNDLMKLRLFFDSVRAEFDKGGDVPRVSPDRVGAELLFAAGQFNGQLQWIEASKQNHPGADEEPTPGYTRVDASINWVNPLPKGELVIFLRGTNLLDEDIRHATSFLREVAPEPGRGLTTGVRVSF